MTKFHFASAPEGFDNHINASVRGYSDLIYDVAEFSQYFVEDNTAVVDLGCSTGKLLKMMLQKNKFAPRAGYFGIEIEPDFYGTYEADELAYEGRLKFVRDDIRRAELQNCSYVTSIFTLQFMPIADRRAVIKRVYDGLTVGGAFVFAEKTMSVNSKVQDIRTFTHYDFKLQSFPAEEILTKEARLRHMMKPTTREWLCQTCESVGFSVVDSFWQNHAFTGFIALKE